MLHLVNCFSTFGLVSATDDCDQVDLVIKDHGDRPVCAGHVEIVATTIACGQRSGAYIDVLIDSDPPVVSASLSRQHLCGSSGGMENLLFSYTAVDGGDKCTQTGDLDISIKVFSNEVTDTEEKVCAFVCKFDNGDIMIQMLSYISFDFLSL